MAKSSRSSARKANNQRKANNLYGPAEAARAERLSARLLEIAKEAKPERPDVSMEQDDDDLKTDGSAQQLKEDENAAATTMDVDSLGAMAPKRRPDRRRVDKRKMKKSGIVFKKYSDRVGSKKKKSAR